MKIKFLILFFYAFNQLSAQVNLGCCSDHFNDFINGKLKRNSPALKRTNQVEHRHIPSPKFIWPLRASKEYEDIPTYYTISNFVDLDPDPIAKIDYQCNQRTYNKHKGIDITAFPFMWHMMEEDYVEVIAAADGVVFDVSDENFNDYNCDGCDSINDYNNAVILEHNDGSKSIYYHIKSNSVIVETGDTVVAGQKIAMIASSGCSTGPHLHFEVRNFLDEVIEPFAGECNETTDESWWQDQHPYWKPRVNRIMCHYAEPELVGYNIGFCDVEHIYAKNNFMPGDDIWFGVAMCDIVEDLEVEIDVYNPIGNNIYADNYVHVDVDDNALYLVFESTLASNAMSGTYKIKVDIGQHEYYHYFTVNCPSSMVVSNDLYGNNGFIAGNTLSISSEMQEGGFPPSYENTDLKIQAGTQISLTPGFHAPGGTFVLTRLRACNFTH